MIADRELRLRRRIDTLADERDCLIEELDAARMELDAARHELSETQENIRLAKATAARLDGPDAGAHNWLAEYDRRKAARRAKRRTRMAA